MTFVEYQLSEELTVTKRIYELHERKLEVIRFSAR